MDNKTVQLWLRFYRCEPAIRFKVFVYPFFAFWYSLFLVVYRVISIRRPVRSFRFFEQKYYSQNGEDGVIHTIFAKIGTTNRFCVEFGIHPGEGNTLYLKKNGWDCLWMDGGGDGEVIKKEYITAENINSLFLKYNVPKEFDLLSIDIDSNDYWVWKAIEGYAPRVVVIEYNASVAANESKAVEYDPNLRWDGSDYYGGSLLAMKRLGESKGYTLITCEKKGINAFFVRSDLIAGNFVVRDYSEIFTPPGYGEIVDGKPFGHPRSERSLITVKNVD